MSVVQSILVHGASAFVIAVMLLICLRSPARQEPALGRKEYRIHGAWLVFAAVGGILVAGIFAVASSLAPPSDRASALWCSFGAAVFFAFFAVVMKSFRVIVDEQGVAASNLFGEQSAAYTEMERIAVVGFVVEIRLKADPDAGKRRRALVFLAGFRGLGELMATIRARAGLAVIVPET